MTGQVPRRKSSVPSWVTPACPSGASAERSCFPPHPQKVFAGPREASLRGAQSSAEGMPMVRPAQAGTMVRGDSNNGAGTTALDNAWQDECRPLCGVPPLC
ncbi:hypothetical protein MRX96_019203 [Rhipicephalus microplus]